MQCAAAAASFVRFFFKACGGSDVPFFAGAVCGFGKQGAHAVAVVKGVAAADAADVHPFVLFAAEVVQSGKAFQTAFVGKMQYRLPLQFAAFEFGGHALRADGHRQVQPLVVVAAVNQFVFQFQIVVKLPRYVPDARCRAGYEHGFFL